MQIEDFSIRLHYGAGNGDPRDGLCFMQAVSWFSGDSRVSDRPKCASPALCELGIRLNDAAPSQAHRDSLWPLVWQLLDSRDPFAEQVRVEYVVREVAHRIVAPLFGEKYPGQARRLGQARSMKEVEAAAVDAMEAAARWSAGPAWVASWTADAAQTRGARAVASAAEAATVAGARSAWEELRAIFIETIVLGRHGSADPIYVPRALELARVLGHSYGTDINERFRSVHA